MFAVTGLHDIDEYIQAQLLLAVSTRDAPRGALNRFVRSFNCVVLAVTHSIGSRFFACACCTHSIYLIFVLTRSIRFLQALNITTHVLKKGGTFVAKVTKYI